MVNFQLGEPCFLGVHNEYLDGRMYDFAVDCHPGVSQNWRRLAHALDDDSVLYLCVPLGRGEEIRSGTLPSDIETMMRVGSALEKLGICS